MSFKAVPTCVLAILFVVGHVEAHGYLKSPRSRNYVAYEDGVWSDGGAKDTKKESCPHCLSLGGTLAQCGLNGNRNYDLPLNVFGDPLAPSVQATFSRGDEIDVEVVLTAHHKGHFEFAACAISEYEIPSADCFKPLEFVSDLLYGAPKDPNYPERAMIPPLTFAQPDNSGLSGTRYAYRMKLPSSVYGDLVLLQWHYYTANSCTFPGYDSYPFPAQWSYSSGGAGLCGDLPPDGKGVPEQFWNCAEIRIVDGPVAPTSTPMQAPTVKPEETQTEGTQTVSSVIQGTCGGGRVGNGVCPDSSLCCSQWGWCGATPSHCVSMQAAPPAPKFTRAVGTCSGGNVGNGKCPNPSECCSKWGWCGTSSDHCNNKAYISVPKAPLIASPETLEFPEIPDLNPGTSSCPGVSDAMTVNFGYYQSWARWRSGCTNPRLPADIDVSGKGYTHLAYSFAGISADGRLEPMGGDTQEESNYSEFNAIKSTYPWLKTLIAVGGWSFNDPGPTQTRFSDVCYTQQSREKFALSVLDFCQRYGFDGIDLDWEYPGDTSRGGRAEDKQNYALLVEEIRKVFDDASENMEISMAVPISASILDRGYDLPSLARTLDFFNVMSYDMAGPWSSDISAHTDLPTIESSIEYFLDNQVPSNKLVLGLAGYGRTFTLSSPVCKSIGCSFSSAGPGGCGGAPGYMPYFTINDYVKNRNYDTLRLNSETSSMEMVVDGNTWITYDNPTTWDMKVSYANQMCMKGYMWWAVDMV